MMKMTQQLPGILCLTGLMACGASDTTTDDLDGDGVGAHLDHTLFVVADNKLKAFDIASGDQLDGEVENVPGAVDLTVLENGTILADITANNEVLIVDGIEMLELARVPSSKAGGVSPVHAFVTPTIDDQRFWMVHNDGNGEEGSSSLSFVDINPDSDTYLQHIGEVELGLGHHKACVSSNRRRVVSSNISECGRVLEVVDYTDPTQPRVVASASAEDLGWNGSSFPRTCDPTFQMGVPPSAHGSVTSLGNGKCYHNLTGSGEIVEIDLDADKPTFEVLATSSAGGSGYTAHGPGNFLYSLHDKPREGAGGEDCQIGQLTVLMAADRGHVHHEVPLFYYPNGEDCSDKLAGTDEESTRPGHIIVDEANERIFIAPAGGFRVAEARIRYEIVMSISDPGKPVQEALVPIATGTGHIKDALSGDGKYAFVVGEIDGEVTQLDTQTLEVVRRFDVGEGPVQAATFGSTEGPSHRAAQHHARPGHAK